MRVAVIALGAIEPRQAEAAVRRHFGEHDLEIAFIERRKLLRAGTLLGLRRCRYSAAVLLAADLGQARLRLTSALLALVRAERRWRIDLLGRRERWTLGRHVAENGWPMARHLAACGLAWAFGETALRMLEGRIGAAALVGRRGTREQPSTALRVLYLRSQLWLGLEGGGSVAHTAGVIGGLEALGAEVRVVASDQLRGVGAMTHVVGPEVWFDGWRRELEDLAYNVPFFWAALKVARGFRPDVIYQRHTAFNVSGVLLARMIGRALVLEFNSSELWKGQYWGGLRLRDAAALVERINLHAADRIVVVSRVLRDELALAGIPKNKILVNANAVDPGVFSPAVNGELVRQRLGITPDEVVIGFSGTFGAWHGIPTLAAAIPAVLDARANARWLLMGDGSLRPLIDEALAGTQDAARRVLQVGMLPHAEMPSYLAACDILVSPHGRQADGGEFFGSPTKLYEYMAMGKPIVASRVGQIGEALTDEQSALLVSPDHPEQLATAIVRLIDEPALRERLGCAARQAAETRHTWRQNAERVLECLDQW